MWVKQILILIKQGAGQADLYFNSALIPPDLNLNIPQINRV